VNWNGKIEALCGLADAIEALLRGLDDGTLRAPHGGGWSAIEIAGHLRDEIEVCDQRLRRILREDRPVYQPFDQDAYVRDANYADMPLAALIDAIRNDREDFAALLRGLDEAARARTGVHAESGVENAADMLDMIIAHDEAHLADIRAAIGA